METAPNQNRLSLRSYSEKAASHSHPFHQIIVALEGRLELETDAASDVVDRDKAAVVTAGRAHAYRSCGDNRFLILDVPCRGTEAAAGLWDLAADRPFLFLDSRLHGLLDFVRGGRDRVLPPAEIRASLSSLILHGLTEQLADDAPPASLRRATAFIDANYPRPITTRDIAAAAGVSVAGLHRLFRTWQGSSPGRYLSWVRLARARDMLSAPDASIAEIAVACGYSEQSALTRAMRRASAVTPAAFRNGLRRRP